MPVDNRIASNLSLSSAWMTFAPSWVTTRCAPFWFFESRSILLKCPLCYMERFK